MVVLGFEGGVAAGLRPWPCTLLRRTRPAASTVDTLPYVFPADQRSGPGYRMVGPGNVPQRTRRGQLCPLESCPAQPTFASPVDAALSAAVVPLRPLDQIKEIRPPMVGVRPIIAEVD